MSAMSFLLSGVPVVRSSRRDNGTTLCQNVPTSHHQLYAAGVRKLGLISSSRQARGRCFITASASRDPQGISTADHLRKSRTDALSPEASYLAQLVSSLTRSASFDEKVASRTQSPSMRFLLGDSFLRGTSMASS